jgi:hypothetical protein
MVLRLPPSGRSPNAHRGRWVGVSLNKGHYVSYAPLVSDRAELGGLVETLGPSRPTHRAEPEGSPRT